MSKKEPSVEQGSIEQLEGLIISIKTANPLVTEESISQDLGYNEGYIAQCRSRKTVSDKFISRLQIYLERLQNAKPDQPAKEKDSLDISIDAILRIADSNKVLGEANKSLADSNRILVDSNAVLVNMLKEKLNESKQGGSGKKKLTTWNKEKTSSKAG